jgi:hypothetical protein
MSDVDFYAMNCPPAWAGEHLDTFAYILAGALSTVMLPSDQVMPTVEIEQIIERIKAEGPLRRNWEDD